MSDTLVINEIYLSLQGESTLAGLPCIFIRLTACNLRCSYCDTAYAFTQGEKKSLGDIRAEVHRRAIPFQPSVAVSAVRVHPGLALDSIRKLPVVELTGGEPLLQRNSLPLMSRFCDHRF